MQDIAGFPKQIFTVDAETFDSTALSIFRYQAAGNPVYRDFLQYLDISPDNIQSVRDIPFLPISAFKNHKVITGNADTAMYFESSSTTDSIRSRHYVVDHAIYEHSYVEGFKRAYGDITQYCILALLPSYLERSQASLVAMCAGLIERSGHADSGFYLHDLKTLSSVLVKNRIAGIPTILIGVTFALLDLAEQFSADLGSTIIIETGGMKGRREEITREALHAQLTEAFKVKNIYSEYGMTELFSQAYMQGDGLFACPPWMQVMARDSEDPFQLMPKGKTGCLNIIDLANVHSCSFIATDDLGAVQEDGRFTVTGRFDSSDVRGCNLMLL